MKNKCNNCGKNIQTELRALFWDSIPEREYFEFDCPYCKSSLKIEVMADPIFIVLSDEEAAEIVW